MSKSQKRVLKRMNIFLTSGERGESSKSECSTKCQLSEPVRTLNVKESVKSNKETLNQNDMTDISSCSKSSYLSIQPAVNSPLCMHSFIIDSSICIPNVHHDCSKCIQPLHIHYFLIL